MGYLAALKDLPMTLEILQVSYIVHIFSVLMFSPWNVALAYENTVPVFSIVIAYCTLRYCHCVDDTTHFHEKMHYRLRRFLENKNRYDNERISEKDK